MGPELVEEPGKIVTGEFPLERLGHGFVVGLECEQAVFDRSQRREESATSSMRLATGMTASVSVSGWVWRSSGFFMRVRETGFQRG